MEEMMQPLFNEAFITVIVGMLLQSGLTLNHNDLCLPSPFPPLSVFWT